MKNFDIKQFTSSLTDIGNGVCAWERDVEICNECFKGTALFGFCATYLEFRDCEFEYCNFKCVDISHSDFEGCTFTNCLFECNNLSYCNFRNCIFRSTESPMFSDSRLESARFIGCHLLGVSFSGCQAQDIFIDEGSHAYSLHFCQCELERSVISPLYTGELVLSKCNLVYASIKPVSESCIPLKVTISHCITVGADFGPGQIARYGTILKEEMLGYKKCRDGIIVTLRIPAGAVVLQPNMGKCRTNVAEVVSIEDSDGNPVSVAFSKWNGSYGYRFGEVKRVDNFCLDPSVECAPGIHFFKTKEEAEAYE